MYFIEIYIIFILIRIGTYDYFDWLVKTTIHKLCDSDTLSMFLATMQPMYIYLSFFLVLRVKINVINNK